MALAHLVDAQRELHLRQRVGSPDATDGHGTETVMTQAWLVAVLGISGFTVLAGLGLALMVSYNVVAGFVRLFAPVVQGVDTAVQWLIEALAFVLFLLSTDPSRGSRRICTRQPARPSRLLNPSRLTIRQAHMRPRCPPSG